jgi:hypothetical protein
MNPFIVPLAIVSGLALAAIGAAWLAVWKVKSTANVADQSSEDRLSQTVREFESVRGQLSTLEARIAEFERQPQVQAPGTFQPKMGLNLNKRSQVLRMHRRGEAAGEIATALNLPAQEVDLLLKVHRIVVSNV